MSLICAFTYYGAAIGKARPRVTTVGGYARAYTPNKTGAFETKLRAIAAVDMAQRGLSATPDACLAEISIERAPLKSWSKRKAADMRGVPIAVKPDVDNIVKSILDSLNGIAFEDDAQVSDLKVSRRWGEVDRVHIRISLATGPGVLSESA